MEHEVFVPVEAEPLRQALADAARVARSIPGLQRDAQEGAEPVSGRLRVRIAGHTITYRGVLRVTEEQDGSFALAGDAAEARGSGTVEGQLAVRLLPADGGTRLRFSGTGKRGGRIAELSGSAVSGAVERLLNRFVEALAAEALVPEAGSGEATGGGVEEQDQQAQGQQAQEQDADDRPDVFETPVPPSSLDPFHQDAGDESFVAPPAEAAHARRTMIGRSAEEVDHAPPRGRYAPVPAPQAATTTDTLRWAAPAAALVIASAIVVGRVLRRRK